MQAYTGFAQVYDIFMDNVPYEEWADYLIGLLNEYDIMEGLVLELGCGTGNITRCLAAKGYDMIGIDNSEDMLEIARDKEYDNAFCDNYYKQEENIENEYYKPAANPENDYYEIEGSLENKCYSAEVDSKDNCFEIEGKVEHGFEQDEEESEEYLDNNRILYLQQDMRNFELYGTVAAVVSICDSMNYITSDKDLLAVFQLVNNYLDANGIFIFDMNTEYKYKHILSDNTIAENREDCSFIWENFYNVDTMINEYDVTIYVKLEEDESEDDDIEEDEFLDNELEEDELQEDEMEENELEEDWLEDGQKDDQSEVEQEDDLEETQNLSHHKSAQLFERFQETHFQKAYSLETVKKLLKEAGLEYVAVYDAFTHNSPSEQTERVYFVAREKHQDKKKYTN